MAIFSCVIPDAHQTLPRSGSRPVRRPGLQSFNDGSNDAKAVRVSARPMSWNGQMPARALSSRDLSKRNGAKLQKRARVSKTMIGVPTNFVHCSHMERGDAKNAFSSKELQDIQGPTPAPASDQAKEEARPQAAEESNDTSQHPAAETEGVDQAARPSQAASAPAKRKAPPPITASIIKAAGLPSPESTSVPPVPAVPEGGEVVVIERKKRPLSVATPPAEEGRAPANGVGDLYDDQNNNMLTVTVGRANGHLAAAPLPPTVSSIRRDIEKLLDGPVDGMPSDAEPAGSDDLLQAPTGASPTKPGISHSSTLRNLALSSSMENLVKEAITVDDEKAQQEHDRLVRSNTISKADPADLLKLEQAVENLRKDYGDERHESSDSFTTAIPAPTPQQL